MPAQADGPDAHACPVRQRGGADPRTFDRPPAALPDQGALRGNVEPVGHVHGAGRELPTLPGDEVERHVITGRQERHGRYPAATASATVANPARCAGVMRRAWWQVGKQTIPVVSLPR